MRGVETVLFLVVVATVVATFARRLRVPAPSLLVVAGLLVGLLPGVPQIRLTPDVVSLVVLPPLLYAAAEELPWRDLRVVWRPVTALAVGLVITSAAAVAAVVVAITDLPVGLALVLGAVLASTDPVAVTALGRRLSLPPRVQALVQAESLFNDATSLLLFRIAVSLAVTVGGLSAGHVIGEFCLLAGGGALVGLIIAAGVTLIRRRTEDPVLETVIALVTPYASYVLAESVHASGVTAVVVVGVALGNQAASLTNARIRLQLAAVWRTVVFLLESVVFGLIGLELPELVRELSGTDYRWPLQALAITATLLVIRVLWVFPLSVVAQRRRERRPGERRMSWQVPAVVSWAGARGVVPLAAALSIPLIASNGAPLPHRDEALLLASAVIVITLVVQGFTLAPLVSRAGIAVAPADIAHEHTVARLHVASAGIAHLEQLADLELAPDAVLELLRYRLQSRIDRLRADNINKDVRSDVINDVINDVTNGVKINVTDDVNGGVDGDIDEGAEAAGAATTSAYLNVRRELLAVQSAELTRLFEAGVITETTRRRLQHDLDLEEARLGDDG